MPDEGDAHGHADRFRNRRVWGCAGVEHDHLLVGDIGGHDGDLVSGALFVGRELRPCDGWIVAFLLKLRFEPGEERVTGVEAAALGEAEKLTVELKLHQPVDQLAARELGEPLQKAVLWSSFFAELNSFAVRNNARGEAAEGGWVHETGKHRLAGTGPRGELLVDGVEHFGRRVAGAEQSRGDRTGRGAENAANVVLCCEELGESADECGTLGAAALEYKIECSHDVHSFLSYAGAKRPAWVNVGGTRTVGAHGCTPIREALSSGSADR
jgi:hypothetical protein